MPHKSRQLVWTMLFCASAMLAACGIPARANQSTPTLPTPTVAGLFHAATPTLTAATMSASPEPTQAMPTAAPAATATSQPLEEIPIYDEVLNKNWSLANSDGMAFDLTEDRAVSHGSVAAAITPTKDFGRLFFTVRKQSTAAYLRERVLGVRFWLNGGPRGVRTGDLAVTVVGSNKYSYWVEDDTSVKVTGRVTQNLPLFSETRLYYLGINRDIEPNTWVEVELWLDDNKYDPDYTYVTGVYIKNDEGFRSPFYIDRVSLIAIQ
jgi:hypothetical protein